MASSRDCAALAVEIRDVFEQLGGLLGDLTEGRAGDDNEQFLIDSHLEHFFDSFYNLRERHDKSQLAVAVLALAKSGARLAQQYPALRAAIWPQASRKVQAIHTQRSDVSSRPASAAKAGCVHLHITMQNFRDVPSALSAGPSLERGRCGDVVIAGCSPCCSCSSVCVISSTEAMLSALPTSMQASPPSSTACWGRSCCQSTTCRRQPASARSTTPRAASPRSCCCPHPRLQQLPPPRTLHQPLAPSQAPPMCVSTCSS